jgi:TATA-binding protein-associated factor Taf7
MSRQIDFTKPLSDSDREWLVTNARFDLIRQNEAYLAGTIGEDPNVPDEHPGASPDAVPASPAAVLRAQAEQKSGAVPVADPVPVGGLAADQGGQAADASGGQGQQPTEPTIQAGDGSEDDEDADDEDAEDEGDNYDDEEVWSYQDLVDEYKARVERGLEKGPNYNGSREEIISYLREDDESEDESDD